jgi:hypothetical protein
MYGFCGRVVEISRYWFSKIKGANDPDPDSVENTGV